MKPNTVYTISYQCRPIGRPGDSIEEGIIDAFWTGEIDAWGKYTIVPINGQRPLYFFPDEIANVEPYHRHYDSRGFFKCELCNEPAGEGGALCPACQEAR